MARPKLIRDLNQAGALLLLKEHQTLSRAAFARALSLTRKTVTSVTSELLDQGLLIETGETFVTEATGRPGQGLRLNPDGAFFLGVALDIEKLTAVVVNLCGEVIFEEDVYLENSSDTKAVISTAVMLVKRIVSKRFKNSPKVRGVGLAIPGMVSRDGVVRFAPQIKWREVSLRQILSKHISIPLFIENNANAAALAEVYFGKRTGASNLCVLMLNDGVGAGIIVDRKIFRGGQGYAGEIGHLDLRLEGVGLPEGTGYLESVLGRVGLLTGYGKPAKKIRSLKHFTNLLRQQDASAKAVVDIWSDWLVLAIRSIADLYNPSLVILSGQLSSLYEFVDSRVIMRLQSREFPTVDHLQVEVSSFGENICAVGGAALAYESLFSPALD
jgi:predicted NBD/HSP70 family sugar kinase